MARIWSDEGRLARWLEVEARRPRRLGRRRRRAGRGCGRDPGRAVPPTPERVGRSRSARSTTSPPSSTPSPSSSDRSRLVSYGLTSSDILDTALSLQIREAGACARGNRVGTGGGDRTGGEAPDDADDRTNARRPRGADDVRAQARGLGVRADRARGRGCAPRSRGCGSASSRARSGCALGHRPGGRADRLERLGLEPAPASTQILQRDRHAELLAALALTAASLEKFALEIRHLARTEVREAEEPFGARSERVVRDAAQAQSRRCRAHLRFGACRAVGCGCRPRKRRALAQRDISHSSIGRDPGRVSRARLHARPVHVADRRARRAARADATEPRREPRPSSSVSGCCWRWSRAGSSARGRTSSCSERRCGPGRGAGLRRAGSRRPTSLPALEPTALEEVFDLGVYTRHVDVVFERLHALTRREEPVHA